MPATYTWDVLATLDGFGSYTAGDWGGYWSKDGPEFLEHRRAEFDTRQRMVFGATTFREMLDLFNAFDDPDAVGDASNALMRHMPATVVSTTLKGPLAWPDATIADGDALDVVARLKQESELPLRSHGSLAMNRALMAAGLVDRVQVTIFPVISGQTGSAPILRGAADFDLELLESRTFDGSVQQLVYRPTLRP